MFVTKIPQNKVGSVPSICCERVVLQNPVEKGQSIASMLSAEKSMVLELTGERRLDALNLNGAGDVFVFVERLECGHNEALCKYLGTPNQL